MKHYKFSFLAVLLTIVGSIHADNLTISDVELKAGETKEISIDLNNSSKQYVAFQFDLVLPEGVSIAKNNKGKFIAILNEDRIDDHSLNVSDMGSNTYRLLSFSMTNAEFYGTSGTLVTVTLEASESIGSGAKTATITEQVFTDVNGDQDKWSDLSFTITIPGGITITAPTAMSGLTYNGSTQELITTGSTSSGTLQYSLDGRTYSTAIPKGTDANTYTVYYKAVDSGNNDLSTAASLTVAISPKTVSSPAITLSQTSYEYDGQEKKPTVSVMDGSTTIPASEYTVSYSDNINAGIATVTITDNDGGNYVVSGTASFTITAASATVIAPTAKPNLVYNGSEQELVVAGRTSAGEMQYSLDGRTYSTAIPKGTDAKTYTVYYKAVDSGNNDLSTAASLTVTISPKTVNRPVITLSETSYEYDGQEKKPTVSVMDGSTTIPASEYTVSYSNNINVGTATVTITDNDGGNYVVNGTASFTITSTSATITAPTAKSDLVYNGSKQELVTAGSTSAGELLYSLDDRTYSTAIPKGTDAKTYTVYYKVVSNGNYGDTEPATLTVTISPKTVRSPVITFGQTTFVYDGLEKKPNVLVMDGRTMIPKMEYTVSYSNNINVGTATVTITDNDGGNYIVSGTATFEIREAIDVVNPEALSGLVYNGNDQQLITSGSSSDGKMVYSLDGINYFETIPTAKDAGIYTVYFKVVDEAQTTDYIASSSLNVTINKASLTIAVNDYTIIVGEPIPVFEPVYNGFVGNETEAVLTKKPSINCEATKDSNPGKYKIELSGAEASNYDISYVNGWLTIEENPNEFEEDGISYLILTDQTVAFTGDNKATGEYDVPEYVVHDGKTYTVTVIRANAFRGNTGLTQITIPSTVVSIEDGAFADCKNLSVIIIYVENPIDIASARTRSEASSVFEGVDKEKCILYVPEGSVDAYKAAAGWREFKTILPISALSIREVLDADKPFDVYNIQGRKVRSGVTSLNGLHKGVYIINGKKVIK